MKLTVVDFRDFRSLGACATSQTHLCKFHHVHAQIRATDNNISAQDEETS